MHGMRAHAKFIQVCFSGYNGPGILQLLDHRGIERAREFFQDFRSACRGEVARTDIILNRDQPAVSIGFRLSW